MAEKETLTETMMKLSTGFVMARAIYAVAKLNVADHLNGRQKTAKELAELVGAESGILHRIMRTVAGLGIFHQDENDAFSLTPLGETLRSGAENSMRDYVLFFHEFIYPSVGEIVKSVKTGEPGFTEVFGMPFFEYTKANPEAAQIFNSVISKQSRSVIPSIMEVYDFSDCGCIVDVGGGKGTFLSSILTANDQTSGILFEVSSAVEEAKAGQGGPLPRCDFVIGDFFKDDIPQGDTLILKSILHSWSDEKSLEILKNCRKKMANGARALVIEKLVGPANELTLTHLSDLTMMTMFMTQERTEDQYAELLKQADIRLERSIPTTSSFYILEAFVD